MSTAPSGSPALSHPRDPKVEVLLDALSTVIRGKSAFLELFVAGFLAGGHILIEDLPGLGKTTVAKTLARLVSGEKGKAVLFRRIQFTPDLLPYDITGVDVYDPDKKGFYFSPGPIFACVVLADEINRTTPKVQSALLEVMAERQVTVGNTTHMMDELFFVVATQNPLEMEGTYPLPLAQLDRFLMRLAVGFPDADAEFAILKDDPSQRVMPLVEPVLRRSDVIELRNRVGAVHVADELVTAVVALASATRSHEAVDFGLSPRAGLMVLSAARGLAFVRGREFVIDQDIVDVAVPVLVHRLRSRDPRLDLSALMRELTIEAIDRTVHRI